MVSSNNSRIFLKLNNYDYSRENIDAVASFLETRVPPADMNDRQRRTFVERYGRDFKVRDGKVIYVPLNLEMVSVDDADAKLKELYDDPAVGTGAGIKVFYGKVIQHYLGIRREKVKLFLESQTPYQLTKRPPFTINKPVMGEYPNHRWEIDLIDVNYYAGYNKQKKYVLTVIDVFSRYVWAQPLANKKPTSIVAAMNAIKKKSKVFPVVCQCDGGMEFFGEFKTWATDNNVQIVHSLSHTPTTNGLVENFNGFLRKMMRDGFVRTNSLNWIDYLQDYCDNRNNTRHSRLRHTPTEMWSPTRVPLEKPKRRVPLAKDAVLPKNELQTRVLEKNKAHTKKILENIQDQKFKVDDNVRIKMAAIDTNVRKANKAGLGKLVVVRYTPEVYRVMTVYQSRTNLAKPQYVTTYSPKRFFGSDLQHVDNDAVDADINVTKLNKI